MGVPSWVRGTCGPLETRQQTNAGRGKREKERGDREEGEEKEERGKRGKRGEEKRRNGSDRREHTQREKERGGGEMPVSATTLTKDRRAGLGQQYLR